MARRRRLNEIANQWEQFAALIENFAEYLYVVDPKTYKVLLVNNRIQSELGINPVGRLCYQIFQGLDEPCAFCTNPIILASRKPYIWEFHNKKVGRDFLIVDQILDWPDGREVRFEVALDITERKRAEEALRKAKFELEARAADLQKANSDLRELSSRILKVQEDERKAIALELHDTILQKLAYIKISLGAYFRRMGNDGSSPDRQVFEETISLMAESIAEIRSIMENLTPSMLKHFGLIKTLEGHCQEFQSHNPLVNLEAKFDVCDGDILEQLNLPIFRILQEALNNVAKHSRASRVKVALSRVEDRIHLEVSDNGRGFKPEKHCRTDSGGFGLESMQERTELSGGSFQLSSQEGQGTKIVSCWDVSQFRGQKGFV